MRGGYDIVAAITRALALRLQDAVNQVGGGLAQTQVTTRRPSPGDTGQTAQINLCLFHVLPNPYLRNLHEPWRMEGRQVEQPVTALDLYYLISFLGPEHMDQLDPQRLLGITANALNVRPVLEPRDLHAAGAAAVSADATVEITPHSLTIEELSRLWSMFAHVPYQLSVCYRVSAALVVADVALQPRPPNSGIVPRAGTLQPIEIRTVAALDGGAAVHGAAMVANGTNFTADVTLTLDGIALPITSVSPDAITFVLDGDDLRAGQGLLQAWRAGQPAASASLAMGPSLVACAAHVRKTGSGFGGRIVLTLEPPVQPGQSVELDLFSAGHGAAGFGFRIVKAQGGRSSAEVEVTVSALPAGPYATLVKVDGTPGRLARDAAGAYLGPFLVIKGSRAG